jgi:uncharacterized protein (DUF58 family)
MKKPNFRTGHGLLSALTPLIMRHRAENAAAGLPSLMAAAERAVSTLYAGDHRQRKAGSGEKFWQFREYDPSDRPQDIDWRQSAKGDRIFIRQKEWQTAQTILFWAQNDKGMSLKTGKALASKHETAVILSLALGILLIRAGERIGPLDEPNRAGRSELALQHMGEFLCRMPEHLPLTPALPLSETLPRQSSLVLAGDFLQPTDVIDKTLSTLAAQAPHGVLFQILDPSEADLPFNGRVIFRPFDDSRDFSIANVPSIREAYRTRLKNHIEAVRTIAQRHGYGHVVHITRDDPRNALSAAWQILAPQPRLQAGGNGA